MHIFLGADHRGYQLKNEIIAWLVDQQIPYTDFGATEYDAEDDYNDYAKPVAKAIQSATDDKTYGILICGSAQGMCMQANRFKGVRAALCSNATIAAGARMHNNANVVCIPADYVQDHFSEILDAFFETKPNTEEKYQRRNQKLDEE